MRRSTLLVPLVALLLVLLAVAAYLRIAHQSEPAQTAATASEAPTVGGPFTLVAPDGRTVTERDFRGRWMLVFFGYTFCPDVCPTALASVGLTLERLGPLADRLAPVFISIDPERDTPEVVGAYVRQFDPRITGLTGTPEQVRAAAQAYRAFFRKVAAEDLGGEAGDDAYLMEHSAWLYLMDPEGRFVRVFPHSVDPEELAAGIAAAMGETLEASGDKAS